ncbi:MAG: glycosyltransferase, partial [Chthoniobacter sp.]
MPVAVGVKNPGVPNGFCREKLLFSISARIGGSGLDLDSFEAVQGAWRAGILGGAVAYDNRQREIPGSLIRSLRWHPVRLMSFLQTRYYYGAKKQYLDWICARQLARGDYDLVHSWSGDCVRTFREARRRGIPTVLEIPTWHRNKGRQKPDKTKSERERDALPFPRRWFERLSPTRQQIMEEYDLSDVILVLSECAADTFLAAGVPREKLYSLPRGTDVVRFTPGVHPEKFRAVFVGALIKRKGVDLLLETWRSLGLKNAELVLVGAVHQEIEEALRQYGGPDVTLAGYVRNPEDYLRQGQHPYLSLDLRGERQGHLRCGGLRPGPDHDPRSGRCGHRRPQWQGHSLRRQGSPGGSDQGLLRRPAACEDHGRGGPRTGRAEFYLGALPGASSRRVRLRDAEGRAAALAWRALLRQRPRTWMARAPSNPSF